MKYSFGGEEPVDEPHAPATSATVVCASLRPFRAAQRGAKLDNMHEQMVSRRLEAKAEARVTQIINLRRSVVQGIIDPNRVDTPDSSAGAAPPHPAAHAVQDTMQEVRHLAAKEVHLAAEAAQHAASGARTAALSAAAGIREAFQEVEDVVGKLHAYSCEFDFLTSNKCKFS